MNVSNENPLNWRGIVFEPASEGEWRCAQGRGYVRRYRSDCWVASLSGTSGNGVDYIEALCAAREALQKKVAASQKVLQDTW